MSFGAVEEIQASNLDKTADDEENTFVCDRYKLESFCKFMQMINYLETEFYDVDFDTTRVKALGLFIEELRNDAENLYNSLASIE